MGSGDKKLEYEKVKSYVLSLAQQRASSMNPRSSEIQGVDTPSSDGNHGGGGGDDKYSSEEWLQWMWDNDIGAVGNPSIQCW
eukprot:7900588-Karenia_brevis.AAC.1